MPRRNPPRPEYGTPGRLLKLEEALHWQWAKRFGAPPPRVRAVDKHVRSNQ